MNVFTYSFIFQPKDVTFEYPNVVDKETKVDQVEKTKKQLHEQAELYRKFLKRNDDSRGSPPWFSIQNERKKLIDKKKSFNQNTVENIFQQIKFKKYKETGVKKTEEFLNMKNKISLFEFCLIVFFFTLTHRKFRSFLLNLRYRLDEHLSMRYIARDFDPIVIFVM